MLRRERKAHIEHKKGSRKELFFFFKYIQIALLMLIYLLRLKWKMFMKRFVKHYYYKLLKEIKFIYKMYLPRFWFFNGGNFFPPLIIFCGGIPPIIFISVPPSIDENGLTVICTWKYYIFLNKSLRFFMSWPKSSDSRMEEVDG